MQYSAEMRSAGLEVSSTSYFFCKSPFLLQELMEASSIAEFHNQVHALDNVLTTYQWMQNHSTAVDNTSLYCAVSCAVL